MHPTGQPNVPHGRKSRRERTAPSINEQGKKWLSRVGVVTVVVLAVGIVVAAYLALRPRPDDQAGVVVGFSAPPTANRLHVVILRGGATGCRPTGGCNDANYAQILSSKEGWTTTVLAQGGTGYVAGADADPAGDFGSRLPDVYAATPDLVIVEGSVGDQYYGAPAIHDAAVKVFADLKIHLPDAIFAAVGPAWAGTAPANIVAIENAVKSAASSENIFFIDPIAQGWFSGANMSLMAPDHQSPTDAGHARIAAMIAADIAPLLNRALSHSPAA
jgi:hypothetical protein